MNKEAVFVVDTRLINGVKGYCCIVVDKVNYNVLKTAILDKQGVLSLYGRYELGNFSINKVNGLMVIEENCGSFRRFHNELTVDNEQGVSDKRPVNSFVLIAELILNGTIIGYRISNRFGYVYNIRIKDFLDKCDKASSRGIALVQNAIFVPNSEERIRHLRAFPGFVFNTIEKTASGQAKPLNVESVKVDKKKISIFTPEQKIELKECKENGVDIRLIYNPRFTPKQMHILWTGKKNNLPVEYIAKPEYSEEHMSYITSKMVFSSLKALKPLFRPEFSIKQLNEMYIAELNGVDTSSYTPSMTCKEIIELSTKSSNELFKYNAENKKDIWSNMIAEMNYFKEMK